MINVLNRLDLRLNYTHDVILWQQQ
jgi:hypothetical protein